MEPELTLEELLDFLDECKEWEQLTRGRITTYGKVIDNERSVIYRSSVEVEGREIRAEIGHCFEHHYAGVGAWQQGKERFGKAETYFVMALADNGLRLGYAEGDENSVIADAHARINDPFYQEEIARNSELGETLKGIRKRLEAKKLSNEVNP